MTRENRQWLAYLAVHEPGAVLEGAGEALMRSELGVERSRQELFESFSGASRLVDHARLAGEMILWLSRALLASETIPLLVEALTVIVATVLSSHA